jgi:hypothetical protein
MRTGNDRPRVLLACAPLALAALLAGCSAKKESAPTKPSKDYASEAKSSIDEKNMDAELEKLKSEVEADK